MLKYGQNACNTDQHEEDNGSPFSNRQMVYNNFKNMGGNTMDEQQETTVGQTFGHSNSLENGSTYEDSDRT